MATLTQTNRLLTLESSLGDGTLIPLQCEIEEALSMPFKISITTMSAKTAIEPASIIGKPLTLMIHSSVTEPPRYFNGIVQTFRAGSIHEGMRTYFVTAKPWLSLLKNTADCRIFQHQNVIDIVKAIFQEFGFADYEVSQLHNTYPPLNYCVQFHESTLNFIQRLLAEAGIFYFFKQDPTRHTLVLADKSEALPYCYNGEVVLDTHGRQHGHYLSIWQKRYRLYGGKNSQSNYNFETPTLALVGKQQKQAKLAQAESYEIYCYSGRHQTAELANQAAQRQLEATEIGYDIAQGEGNYINFAPGGSFQFPNPSSQTDAGDYFLTQVVHAAADRSYLTGDSSGCSQIYHNFFTCIPRKIPYRSALFHNSYLKPLIYGPQTAMVVGPSGEEIYTDKYGRVKIQFHWVRNGSKDDKSSCWVRVAQSWAGRGFGTFFLPRIGEEVVVQFLDGDPDRPLIVGSVYNAEHLPPYSLPSEQTKSGIKTHSTKGGGSNDCNELRFEDKLGNEEIYLHAQKDFNRKIENSETALIVKGDHNIKVEAGKSILEASQSIELRVAGSSITITPEVISITGAKVLINKP